ncbi:MAG: lysine--tRNA ligase [Verrucomicrobia bacterium]|nr:lysine--tRNA ligase [Verrucomicrobiota bacterium]
MQDDHRIIQDRIKKVETLRAEGIEPYPYRYDVTHRCAELRKQCAGVGHEPAEAVAALAGRIMLHRPMGKTLFATIQDGTDRMQLYFRRDHIGDEAFALAKRLAAGDLIGARGRPFMTKTGELTVFVDEFTLLCAAVRPLPEKYHGLHDKELRYRQRYVDLIMNPEVRDTFVKRARIIASMRATLEGHGFLEVETPTLQPIYGGANARPFVTHHNTLDMRLYLRVSNELYLKRLLVGGFERVYEFVKDFRNEGMDRTHNPEFTQVEFYMAYGDYTDAIRLVEELWQNAALAATGSTKVPYQDVVLDFTPPWERMTMVEAIQKHAGLDVMAMSADELRAWCQAHEIEVGMNVSKGLLIEFVFEHACEGKFIQPTFITEFPIETTPLCKPRRDHTGDEAVRFVERFEPYVYGWEVGNAYSELNDPLLQRTLLEEQAARGRGGDEEAHPMDEDFVRAIEYGMPPAAGVGIGVDRMVMLLTNSYSIRDVILFPMLRPETQSGPQAEEE